MNETGIHNVYSDDECRTCSNYIKRKLRDMPGYIGTCEYFCARCGAVCKLDCECD